VVRVVGLALGLAVAAAAIVGMQLPLLQRPSSARQLLRPVLDPAPATALAWPSVGSAALYIPSLGVLEGYRDAVAPIASLTKMMTAYVALAKLPLGLGQSGPCHTVTSYDVANYEQLEALGESTVPVVEGEQLCEIDLLEGVLVHSAGNYAVMLANMVAGSNGAFVADMNSEAKALGLAGTSYVDVTGLSPQSESTALDQVRLSALLMESPLVRSIVIQSSVTLPDVGSVNSFTPYVGTDNVIGVKSGRTQQAGGCDALAMDYQQGWDTRIVYVVVLGQQGGDLLGPAGEAALALANSAVANRLHYTLQKDQAFGEISYGARHVALGLAHSYELWWWPEQGALRVSMRVRRYTGTIHHDEVVGQLIVQGAVRHTYPLVALGQLAPLSLLQRIR